MLFKMLKYFFKEKFITRRDWSKVCKNFHSCLQPKPYFFLGVNM